MDPISNADRLVLLLRQKLEERARAGARAVNKPAPGAAAGASGVRALAAFSALYALIYFLLGLEDQALLIGAVASFLAIAAVMYFTRKIDWYGAAAVTTPTSSEVSPGA